MRDGEQAATRTEQHGGLLRGSVDTNLSSSGRGRMVRQIGPVHDLPEGDEFVARLNRGDPDLFAALLVHY